MATTNGLIRRVEALEATVPTPTCQTCAAHPVFDMSGEEPRPCPECGHVGFVFTIDIDRASPRDGDAA
jgi:hypothetical protein